MIQILFIFYEYPNFSENVQISDFSSKNVQISRFRNPISGHFSTKNRRSGHFLHHHHGALQWRSVSYSSQWRNCRRPGNNNARTKAQSWGWRSSGDGEIYPACGAATIIDSRPCEPLRPTCEFPTTPTTQADKIRAQVEQVFPFTHASDWQEFPTRAGLIKASYSNIMVDYW